MCLWKPGPPAQTPGMPGAALSPRAVTRRSQEPGLDNQKNIPVFVGCQDRKGTLKNSLETPPDLEPLGARSPASSGHCGLFWFPRMPLTASFAITYTLAFVLRDGAIFLFLLRLLWHRRLELQSFFK
jgi:hypothetical protein